MVVSFQPSKFSPVGRKAVHQTTSNRSETGKNNEEIGRWYTAKLKFQFKLSAWNRDGVKLFYQIAETVLEVITSRLAVYD